MRFVDEFRDREIAKELAAEIAQLCADPAATTTSWRCAAATPTPFTSMASKTSCRPTSHWCTARVARSA